MKNCTIAITKINMEVLDNYLKVKRSAIPGTGKGLFTTVDIPKGKIITEYKGKITTWNNVAHDEGKNLYIYYVSRNHVIDAKGNKDAFAHFANDANGPTRVKGMNNNSEYVIKNKRVFIVATKNIPAKAEVLVGYGKEYWDTLKANELL